MKELLFALIMMIQSGPATTQTPSNVQDKTDVEVVKSSWNKFQRSMSTGLSGMPSGLDMQGAGGFDADPFRNRTNDLRVLERSFPKPQKGFAYKAKIRNNGEKTIKRVFWEYQFSDPATSQTLSRRQFLCSVKVKPGADKGLEAFSVSPPSNVVNVASLGDPSGDGLSSKVIINRVDYTDGSTWQRADWSHPKNPPFPADLYPHFRHRPTCYKF